MFREARKGLLSGPHFPRHRVSLPLNAHFGIARHAEFMFLMIGETVLQMIIARQQAGQPAPDSLRQTASPPSTRRTPNTHKLGRPSRCVEISRDCHRPPEVAITPSLRPHTVHAHRAPDRCTNHQPTNQPAGGVDGGAIHYG
mmetsp:Transcript_25294/g.80180  ORF Transcript_25294/g.80180 Transcript_25294/m.80180 type:complete len:142 (+) Transcript_25294:1375-1800(+)